MATISNTITEFKGLKTFALISFIYFLLVGIIWLDGMDSVYKRSDYAVVLGNHVEASGEPSERLAASLGEAKKLYNKRMVRKIIVSGGKGEQGYNEARVMKNYLVKHGVPSRKIIVDSKGVNTHKTAQNSKRWIDEEQSIIVVSQLYHLSRSKMSFHNAGFTNVGAAYPDFFEKRDIFESIREVLVWPFYWLTER